MPFWAEVRRLVERAAVVFSPLGTIGWDLGVTEAGPALIEGYVWWDPPNDLASAPAPHREEASMRSLLQSLERQVRALRSS